MKIPENVEYVLDILVKNGYDAYLVGGCVRDSVMGVSPNDYDITTSAFPEEILECFSACKTIKNGMKHGTVGIVFGKQVIEVTTYRIDGHYSDNRHPDKVEFSRKLTDDLARRDFTVNAVACDINGKLTDPFCGISDIKNKIIRCVGEPDRRFNEDALRILRALRFSSVLGFDIDERTSLSVHKNAHLLKNISTERINSEFSKLVCGKRAGKILFDYFDVMSVFIPGINSISEDIKYMLLQSVDKSENSIVVRLCVLFGAALGLRGAEEAMTELKYDNTTKKSVCEAMRILDTEFTNDRIKIKHLISRSGFETVLLLCKIKRYLCHWKNIQCDEFEATVNAIKKYGECVSISQLAVNGRDCMERLKISGRIVGKVLDMLCSEVIEERLNNEYNELLAAADSYVKQLGDFGDE